MIDSFGYNDQPHGMCCIDFKVDDCNLYHGECDNEKLNKSEIQRTRLYASIIMFGKSRGVTQHNIPNFLESFVRCDVSFDYVYKKKSNKDMYLSRTRNVYLYNVCDFTINVERINPNSFKMFKNNIEDCADILDCWKYFSYQCVFNHRNEPVIIIFGGPYGSNDIYYLNCATNIMACDKNVEFSTYNNNNNK